MFRKDLNGLRHSSKALTELQGWNGTKAQGLRTLASHKAGKHVEELLEEQLVSLLITLVMFSKTLLSYLMEPSANLWMKRSGFEKDSGPHCCVQRLTSLALRSQRVDFVDFKLCVTIRKYSLAGDFGLHFEI